MATPDTQKITVQIKDLEEGIQKITVQISEEKDKFADLDARITFLEGQPVTTSTLHHLESLHKALNVSKKRYQDLNKDLISK